MRVAEAPFALLCHSTEGWRQLSPWVPRAATGHPICGVPVANRTRVYTTYTCAVTVVGGSGANQSRKRRKNLRMFPSSSFEIIPSLSIDVNSCSTSSMVMLLKSSASVLSGFVRLFPSVEPLNDYRSLGRSVEPFLDYRPLGRSVEPFVKRRLLCLRS